MLWLQTENGNVARIEQNQTEKCWIFCWKAVLNKLWVFLQRLPTEIFIIRLWGLARWAALARQPNVYQQIGKVRIRRKAEWRMCDLGRTRPVQLIPDRCWPPTVQPVTAGNPYQQEQCPQNTARGNRAAKSCAGGKSRETCTQGLGVGCHLSGPLTEQQQYRGGLSGAGTQSGVRKRAQLPSRYSSSAQHLQTFAEGLQTWETPRCSTVEALSAQQRGRCRGSIRVRPGWRAAAAAGPFAEGAAPPARPLLKMETRHLLASLPAGAPPRSLLGWSRTDPTSPPGATSHPPSLPPPPCPGLPTGAARSRGGGRCVPGGVCGQRSCAHRRGRPSGAAWRDGACSWVSSGEEEAAAPPALPGPAPAPRPLPLPEPSSRGRERGRAAGPRRLLPSAR